MEGIASETQNNVRGRQKRKNDVVTFKVTFKQPDMVIKLFQKHLQIKPYLVCLNWPSEDETKSLQTDGTSNSYFKVFSLAEVKDRGMQSAYSVLKLVICTSEHTILGYCSNVFVYTPIPSPFYKGDINFKKRD